jgi:hypothetical protein
MQLSLNSPLPDKRELFSCSGLLVWGLVFGLFLLSSYPIIIETVKILKNAFSIKTVKQIERIVVGISEKVNGKL